MAVINGTSGDDSLVGTSVDDTINGFDGHDIIRGMLGNDAIDGGDGDDSLFANGGDDSVLGGLGDDFLSGEAGSDTLIGGVGNDTIVGGDGADLLQGGLDNDILDGGLGNDTVEGGDGSDRLFAGRGSDIISGGDGDDELNFVINNSVGFTSGLDSFDGGAGSDLFWFDLWSDVAVETTLVAGAGGLVLTYADGGTVRQINAVNMETIFILGSGYSGPLPVKTTLSGDFVAAGITSTNAFGGTIRFQASDAVDLFDASGITASGLISVSGGGGNDTLLGGAGVDNFGGGDDDDYLSGAAGQDGLNGGAGNDTLDGGDGDDFLNGGEGNDSIIGGAGADLLLAGGGTSQDTLWGGTGVDTLLGSGGSDVFSFRPGDGHDVVSNFDTNAIGRAPDAIELIDYENLFATPADVLATAVQDGVNVVFHLAANDTVTLEFVQLSNLDESFIRLIRDFDPLTTTNGQTLSFSGVDPNGYRPPQTGLFITLNNDGVIEVGADADQFTPGVRITGDTQFVNNGLIDGRRLATAFEGVETIAVGFDSDLGPSRFTNEGSILVSGEAGVFAFKGGARNFDKFVNNGVIDVLQGLSVGGSSSISGGILGGNLGMAENHGSITVNSIGTAFGVTSNGQVNNTGTINVAATGAGAGATGIEVSSVASNAGDIIVSSGQHIAYGVKVTSSNGLLVNHGNISVTGDTAIAADAVFPSIAINSGTIEAVATNAGNQSIGVSLFLRNNTITTFENSGVITADIAIVAQPTFSPPDNGSLLVLNSGLINGMIQFGAGNDEIDNANGVINGDIHFGAGADFLDGQTGVVNGTAFGGFGNDSLFGGAGADALNGGSGADDIRGGNGRDFVSGGSGDDSVRGEGGHDRVYGDDGNDTLFGHNGNDILEGRNGDDFLKGDGGNDFLIGGAGADLIQGGAGVDTADYRQSSAAVNIGLWRILPNTVDPKQKGGDAQGDVLRSIENVIGSVFDDTIGGDYTADNVLSGHGGDDFLYISNHVGIMTSNVLIGGDGDDTLRGTEGGSDTLDGGAGNDTAEFFATPNRRPDLTVNLETGMTNFGEVLISIENVIGSSHGVSHLIGDNNNNLLRSGHADDLILGGGGADTLEGGAADDNLLGEAGNDRVSGGDGDDALRGNAGNDRVFGDDGNDTLIGGGGNDVLEGRNGADFMKGDGGVDYLIGGNGIDSMFGGAGDDVFIFSHDGANDYIGDWSGGAGASDRIQLKGYGAAFDTFAEVFGAATQVGSRVIIDFGGGDTLTLLNTQLSDLHQDDFLFS